MKKTRLFYLLAISYIAVTSASLVSAKTGTVEIKNNSGEKRKICIYKGHDTIDVFAFRCFTMNADEKVLWNRGTDTWRFKVKIFESRPLLDKYLFSRNLPGDTTVIIMGKGGRFGFSRDERKPEPIKYRLKVCNKQYDQTIYLAIGLETNDVFATRGWWNVEKGECIDLGISEMLYSGWRVEYGNLPRTYYYARTYGERPLFWKGNENDPELCLNEKRAFSIDQLVVDPAGGKKENECDGTAEASVKFRRLDAPKANEKYYNLTF